MNGTSGVDIILTGYYASLGSEMSLIKYLTTFQMLNMSFSQLKALKMTVLTPEIRHYLTI